MSDTEVAGTGIDWKNVADDLARALRLMRDGYDRGYEDLPVAIADKALKWYEDACRGWWPREEAP